jgi:adenosylhomocysteinase
MAKQLQATRGGRSTTNTKAKTGKSPGHRSVNRSDLGLIDRVAAVRSKSKNLNQIVVCTHAKFSTIELCRVLQGSGIAVTFFPVDYSKEAKNIDRLQAMGVQVVERYEDVAFVLAQADCVIEDGARISKIINANKLTVKDGFFSVEQTSGGVRYLSQYPPAYPVINVAMSPVKLVVENQRATPERVMQYFSQSTGKTLSGKRVLVLGFGNIGEGLARLARALGAHVTVYDSQATKRMFARHHGYHTVESYQFDHILPYQDVIMMATNVYLGSAISVEQVLLMKDGAVICNAGSGRGELGSELHQPGEYDFHDAKVTIREEDGHLAIDFAKANLHKTITVLGKAFPLNLHLGQGTSHDAIQVVMALLLAAVLEGPKGRDPGLQALTPEVQEEVARIMLEPDGVQPFEPRYVQSHGLAVSERPYGSVAPFHNELSSDANVSVVRAWFRAGSKTRGHYHRRSQEAYYTEQGEAEISLWPADGSGVVKKYPMRPGDYLLVPEGYFHDVRVTSDEDFSCLVIATPPFQLWDQFFEPTAIHETMALAGEIQ